MKHIIRKVKRLLNTPYYIERSTTTMLYSQYQNFLIEKMLKDNNPGVTSSMICEYEVIVSLTTYGKRLYDVAITIESIMQGSMKPNRIILWLDEGMTDIPIPIALQNQQKRGLEIQYCKDIRSYKKLIPTLQQNPDSIIITIDDDLLYYYDLVEKLVNTHLSSPNDIIANRMHQMVLGKDNKPISYMKWKWCVNPTDSSPLNFFTGGAGTLYPPHSLDKEVFNESVFMEICKFADDAWFNAMALKAGTKVLKCYTHNNKGEDYLANESVQDIGLLKINTGKNCANDIQFKNVFDYYDLWKFLREV